MFTVSVKLAIALSLMPSNRAEKAIGNANRCFIIFCLFTTIHYQLLQFLTCFSITVVCYAARRRRIRNVLAPNGSSNNAPAIIVVGSGTVDRVTSSIIGEACEPPGEVW